MRTIGIGLIGFGTVGSGVIKLLQKNSQLIEQRSGIRLRLLKIVDKDITRPREVKVDSRLLSTNANDILENPEIGIVVELIGGYSPAKEFILKALTNGKHVVTANKALLSRYGTELLEAANRAQKKIFFEASVGGGIPIILSLKHGLIGNQIYAIEGILNGTCNFVLTKMQQEQLDYSAALKEAQKKGFAEADPELDVSGKDTMHKLVVLSRIAFDQDISETSVFLQGIKQVTTKDVQNAAQKSQKIKLIAKAEATSDGLKLSVQPTLIPSTHPFYNIDNELNGVRIIGDFTGEILFIGKGAGMNATASAVVADLVEAAKFSQEWAF